MASQGLLFSEPLIAETGVWCCLTNGIDPAQWAQLCRYIGELSPKDFDQLKRKIMSNSFDVKNKVCHKTQNVVDIPLISIGPSGLGGRYQRESSP
jgi:hypothetical protein